MRREDLPVIVGIGDSFDEPYAGFERGTWLHVTGTDQFIGPHWDRECEHEASVYVRRDAYRAWAGFAMWTGMADTEAK